MQANPITAMQVVDQVKSWTELAAGIWLVVRLLDWVRSLREGIEGLNKELIEQTSAIVTELREMRSDWRTFYGAAPIVPPPALRRHANGD